jgi:hypothetical protein
MTYVIIIGASVLSYFVSVTHPTDLAVAGIDALGLPGPGVIVMLLIFYLILGGLLRRTGRGGPDPAGGHRPGLRPRVVGHPDGVRHWHRHDLAAHRHERLRPAGRGPGHRFGNHLPGGSRPSSWPTW